MPLSALLRRRQLVSTIMTETTAQQLVYPPLRTDTDALRLLILQPSVKKRKRSSSKGDGNNNDVSEELQPRVKKRKRGSPKKNNNHDDVSEELQPRAKKRKRGSSRKNKNYGDVPEELQASAKRSKRGSSEGNEDEDDDVCGDLVSSTFGDKPAYECLSYTWGDQPANKRITINGQRFLVRKNLFNALRNLRQKTPRSLWVDAICINQEDVEERNSQVSLMAFIYRRATRAVVWLGLSPKPYSSMDREAMHIQNEENGKAIITNSYWSRLWIIQEIVLAQEVHFVHGDLEFDWHEVGQLLGHSPLWNTLEERITPLVDHRDRIITDEFRMEALLDKFRSAQCSDKKDKIYGLLGMSHDCSDDEIEVDYTVGLFDLYQKMVDFHQDSPPLRVRDASFFDIRPELDRTIRLMKFSSLIQSLFEGSVEEDARTIDFKSFPKKYYYARGALACKILYLGPTYDQTVGMYKINRVWNKDIEKVYASSRSRGEAIKELRLEDAAYSNDILDWDEAKLATIRNIDSRTSFGFRYSAEDDDLLPEEPEEPEEPGCRDTEAGEDSSQPEPRRFLGTHSRIGFAPPNARVGDEVYNFLDCDVAVVVRRHGTLSDQCKIIGKANLSCREMKEGKEQKITTEALNCVPTELAPGFGFSRPVPVEKDLMMNLKMDIETLQKLTC